MWIERHTMCHKSTSNRMRIEDNEKFQQNEEFIFNSNDTFPKEP